MKGQGRFCVFMPVLMFLRLFRVRGRNGLRLQDNMSAAFGAGDMTSASNAGGGGGGANASNVSGVLGNTISLDEIMRATKTNVRTNEF